MGGSVYPERVRSITNKTVARITALMKEMKSDDEA